MLAGAGLQAETRVITQKIAYLVNDCGFTPHAIAAITFTNKAAKEMLERISKLMGGRAAKGLTCTPSTPWACAIDAPGGPGWASSLSSRSDAGDTTQIIAEMTGRPTRTAPRPCSGRSQLEERPRRAQRGGPHRQRRSLEPPPRCSFLGHDKALRVPPGVDFDDLIRLPVERFTAPEVREAGRTACATCWWTNTRTPTAPSTGCSSCSPACAGHTAVGDDDQAIYAWRGADIETCASCRWIFRPSGHQAGAELPLHHAHPARRQHG